MSRKPVVFSAEELQAQAELLRAGLEPALAAELGELIGAKLPGVGFSVLLWTPGRTLYISNVPRDLMLRGLAEFLERAPAAGLEPGVKKG